MIEIIDSENNHLITRCIDIASCNYFENMILLGDLYPPCNKETKIFGVFDKNLEPKRIISELEILLSAKITPGKRQQGAGQKNGCRPYESQKRDCH